MIKIRIRTRILKVVLVLFSAITLLLIMTKCINKGDTSKSKDVKNSTTLKKDSTKSPSHYSHADHYSHTSHYSSK